MAKVAYAHSALGMGLQFTAVEPRDQNLLQAWLSEVSGECPPESKVEIEPTEASTVSALINLRQVVNEVVMHLVRKQIIEEEKGADLLRQMLR
jgi:hypothetical protein